MARNGMIFLRCIATGASNMNSKAKSVDFEEILQHLRKIEQNQREMMELFLRSGKQASFLQKAPIAGEFF